MNGTTISAKVAMRRTPPTMITPSTMTTATPLIHVGMFHAFVTLLAISYDCTVGSSSPVPTMVEIANAIAYQRCPMAFSM